jgi:NDP-sugar pyrophosphorylase family protein
VTDTLVVFNGDVMTSVDVNRVVQLHRDRGAKATIVLTPVDNPTAYGLVETHSDGTVKRFLEKPNADEITCDTINAGIYVLEPDTFDRIPKDVAYSIERGYFPSLVERGEPFYAYVDRGYWIDIGTPEKYVQVHRDMFDGKFMSGGFDGPRTVPMVSPDARVEEGAVLDPRCFVDAGAHIKAGAVIGPYAVIGRGVVVEEEAQVMNSIIWPNTRIGQHAVVDGPIVARNCHIGRNVTLRGQAVLGDKTALTDYTKL